MGDFSSLSCSLLTDKKNNTSCYQKLLWGKHRLYNHVVSPCIHHIGKNIKRWAPIELSFARMCSNRDSAHLLSILGHSEILMYSQKGVVSLSNNWQGQVKSEGDWSETLLAGGYIHSQGQNSEVKQCRRSSRSLFSTGLNQLSCFRHMIMMTLERLPLEFFFLGQATLSKRQGVDPRPTERITSLGCPGSMLEFPREGDGIQSLGKRNLVCCT